MGTSVSLFANRRQNRIVAEVKEDNARLEARIKSLSEETSRLKAELLEIADSGCETDHGPVPVQKLRVETSLTPGCVKVQVTEKKWYFGTDHLPQCPIPICCIEVQGAGQTELQFETDLVQCTLPIANQLTNAHNLSHCQLKMEKVLGARTYCYDRDGNLVATKPNGH